MVGKSLLHPPTMGVIYFTPNYKMVYPTLELCKTGQITPLSGFGRWVATVTVVLYLFIYLFRLNL
jgi:hypothetical protein